MKSHVMGTSYLRKVASEKGLVIDSDTDDELFERVCELLRRTPAAVVEEIVNPPVEPDSDGTEDAEAEVIEPPIQRPAVATEGGEASDGGDSTDTEPKTET